MTCKRHRRKDSEYKYQNVEKGYLLGIERIYTACLCRSSAQADRSPGAEGPSARMAHLCIEPTAEKAAVTYLD